MHNRIKEIRQQKNISQSKLASELGTTQQAISFYEKGEREPKLETWQKLADFFDVPIAYLQGFGLSNKEAIETCWNWLWKKEGYDGFNMTRELRTFFSANYSNKEIDKIVKDKNLFNYFMNHRFGSVFNFHSLSQMKSKYDLEKKLTIALGSSSKSSFEDAAEALIDDIDFKNDSNEDIQMKLHEVVENIFMYAFSMTDEDKNKESLIPNKKDSNYFENIENKKS